MLWTQTSKELGIDPRTNIEGYKDKFSSGAQAGTIRDIGEARRTIDGRPRIFLSSSAFVGESYLAGRFSLTDVLTHELIHAAGQGPKPGRLGLGHDLSGYEPHDDILEACR